jgi:hypothetical protein
MIDRIGGVHKMRGSFPNGPGEVCKLLVDVPGPVKECPEDEITSLDPARRLVRVVMRDGEKEQTMRVHLGLEKGDEFSVKLPVPCDTQMEKVRHRHHTIGKTGIVVKVAVFSIVVGGNRA